MQDTVILSFERKETSSRDGMSYLPGSGTQPREGAGPGDDQGRHLDASQAAVRHRMAGLEERDVVGQRVGEAGEEAPHLALAHSLDHLGRQADHLALEQRSGTVPIGRLDEAKQTPGHIPGRPWPGTLGDEGRLVGRHLVHRQPPGNLPQAFVHAGMLECTVTLSRDVRLGSGE